MNKKICTLLLILIFTFSFNFSYANSTSLDINARSYIVIDRKSKKVIIGKNEYNKVKMASTTKIMTATVVLEHCNLNDTVTISKKAASTGGSRLGLKLNDKITVTDLLYGLLLCSGNDAAVALAEYTSGSIPAFCNLMNKKAKELNLNNSHFETPHGLDSDGHYTTAYELALMADNALQNDLFRKIVGTKHHTILINSIPKDLNNTNELLGVLNGVYGIKTGFTNGANRCLVTGCKRDDMDIICVVLGCDTRNFRSQDSTKLINYCFDNYDYINVENKLIDKLNCWKAENTNYFKILKSTNSNLNITYEKFDNSNIPVLKSEANSITINLSLKQNLQAPVEPGTIVGSYEICTPTQILQSGNIISTNTIYKKHIFTYFKDFIINYSNILNTSLGRI